jgi:hypothetical protein
MNLLFSRAAVTPKTGDAKRKGTDPDGTVLLRAMLAG